MDATRQFRKFISGQYLSMGIILTLSVVAPSAILYHFNILTADIAVPLGVVCVGLTDSPGPFIHRRNSLFASIAINFLVVLVAGFSRAHAALIFTEIISFGIFFSLIGVYGSRIGSIGLIALLTFIFNIDGHLGSTNILRAALLFSAGGLFYALLALLQGTLRPYKPIQQLMGECIIETSAYLETKAEFYNAKQNTGALYNLLIRYQVNIQQYHEHLRDLLFKTRQVTAESTRKGRVLMLMFLDIVDLFERIVTSQQDYTQLHKDFDDTDILTDYQNAINILAEELHEIGIAVQAGFPSKQKHDIDELIEKLTGAYNHLREQQLTPGNIPQFIPLKQILLSIQDIAERIKKLHIYTTYDRKVAKQYKLDVDLDKFTSHQELNASLLVENISFNSTHFRHAVRVTIALLTGYIVSLFFSSVGHGYWILLTTLTIMKPAYSITRQRNINRLFGTITGGVIGFLIIYFTNNISILFVAMIVAMVIAYSFLRLNYFIGVAGITVYVLLSLSIIAPKSIHLALQDRIIDTLIGSAIATIVSTFVLPAWELEKVEEYIRDAIKANAQYFQVVAENFYKPTADVTEFKLARKQAFVALANLSDNFQRMMSEPKNRQHKLALYHQFVVTTHMLTSYIASLSYYAQTTNQAYTSKEFVPLAREVNNHFEKSLAALAHQKVELKEVEDQDIAINARVQSLLAQRKKELETGSGNDATPVRKTLAGLKTIVDQFYLISDVTLEQAKVLQKIYVE